MYQNVSWTFTAAGALTLKVSHPVLVPRNRTFVPWHPVQLPVFAAPPSVADSASMATGLNVGGGVVGVGVGVSGSVGSPLGADAPGDGLPEADLFGLPDFPDVGSGLPSGPVGCGCWPSALLAAALPGAGPNGISPAACLGSNCDTPTTMSTTTMLAATRSAGT